MNLLLEMGKEALLQGLIFSFAVMACYLTSRIIRCDDLSVEGSFGFGGALTASWLLSDLPAAWTLPLSLAGGAIVGLATGLLHTRLKVHHLIAGIVVTTALYSINLKIAGANVSLFGKETLFTKAAMMGPWGHALFLTALCLLVFFSLKQLLNTEIGLLLRATGCNPALLAGLGREADHYKVAIFCLANALVAMSGALFVQLTTFFSITGSMGTLAVALTGLILSELFSKGFHLSLILGAVCCQSFFAASILLGIDPIWNYLLKAVLIVLFLQLRSRAAQPVMQRS